MTRSLACCVGSIDVSATIDEQLDQFNIAGSGNERSRKVEWSAVEWQTTIDINGTIGEQLSNCVKVSFVDGVGKRLHSTSVSHFSQTVSCVHCQRCSDFLFVLLIANNEFVVGSSIRQRRAAVAGATSAAPAFVVATTREFQIDAFVDESID
jgi:hypothetical protein